MPDLLHSLTQFGAAGLIACMWLVERRATAQRERQLTEAHDRLTAERERLGVLVDLVEANTRAMAGLEAAQREGTRAIERLADVLSVRTRASG